MEVAIAPAPDSASFVMVAENWYPGWEATVDGAPAPVFPADGVFRALYLTTGFHRIELEFHPRHFFWGAAISLLTIVCSPEGTMLYPEAPAATRGESDSVAPPSK